MAGSGPAQGTTQGRVERTTLHKGGKYDLEHVRQVLPDGGVLERDVIRHPGAVLIIPVLPSGELVMIQNHRVAVEGRVLEFPAGTLEPPEPASDCAGRELIEETGYKAATLSPLGWFYTTPGLTDERMHLFVASGLEHVGQRPEEDERITVEIMPVAKAVEMVDDGRLVDGKSMIGLLLALRTGLLKAAGATMG